MAIELVKKDHKESEVPFLDENQKSKQKEEDETKKSMGSVQRKHSANVVPFEVSLENMKKVSILIQDVFNIFKQF
jgi:hypothetical protein